MKDLKFIAIHLLLWVAAYMAFIVGSDGFLSILKFYSWVIAAISIVMLSDRATKEAAEKPDAPAVLRLSGRALHVFMLFGFVWFGHYATGFAVLFFMFVSALHRVEKEKIRSGWSGGIRARSP